MSASSTDGTARYKEYQALVDGRLVPVASLTVEQAQKALCDAYDFIEDIDGMALAVQERIETWRNT